MSPDMNALQRADSSTEDKIEHVDDESHSDYKYKNSNRVRNKLFFGQPCQFLDFTDHLLKITDNTETGKALLPFVLILGFAQFLGLILIFDVSLGHNDFLPDRLLGLAMHRVLAADTAVFHELNTIRIVLLVLESVVISLLAFSTCQTNLYPHYMYPPHRFLYIKIDPEKGDLD